jgi:hypothetical protein
LAELTRLDNGVTVANDPMEGAQSASIGLYAAVGSRSEPEGKGGLAHLVERWRADEVGDQLERQPDIGRQRARVEHRLVARRPRVERTADVLDQLADLARRAAAGALEHHMLEQMRDAVEWRRFVARPGRRIEPDRDGFDALHRPAGDTEAVGEGGQRHHGFGCSFRRFLSARP